MSAIAPSEIAACLIEAHNSYGAIWILCALWLLWVLGLGYWLTRYTKRNLYQRWGIRVGSVLGWPYIPKDKFPIARNDNAFSLYVGARFMFVWMSILGIAVVGIAVSVASHLMCERQEPSPEQAMLAVVGSMRAIATPVPTHHSRAMTELSHGQSIATSARNPLAAASRRSRRAPAR